ncbi:hypothetical protein [Pandoravirus japonicus]|uniref:Uncharacterized protein n=1 Tax=Pandoravirus japonicus TaxID=2823154 RepID=A0A811BP63_9VIRU|nr:hypothetical protein [Pandoravirus japonicus]
MAVLATRIISPDGDAASSTRNRLTRPGCAAVAKACMEMRQPWKMRQATAAVEPGLTVAPGRCNASVRPEHIVGADGRRVNRFRRTRKTDRKGVGRGAARRRSDRVILTTQYVGALTGRKETRRA